MSTTRQAELLPFTASVGRSAGLPGSPAHRGRRRHDRRVDVQDLGAVRRLSAWRSAVRDLDEQVGELTSFGPRAVERVASRLDQLEALEDRAHATFGELAAYLRSSRE